MGLDYGIATNPKHYTCMIDLRGQAGQLDEAQNLIPEMPCEPDVATWGALLGEFSDLLSPDYCTDSVSAADDYYCPNTTTTYNISNSSYHSNLNLLLSTLSNASKEYQFYNFSTGGRSNSERIYGLFMCRADFLSLSCQDFVTRAVDEIVELCPRRKTAIFWSDDNLLRYSNRLIFPDPDYSSIINKPNKPFVLLNTNKISIHEQSRFKKKLGEMMDDMANRAAGDRSIGKKFAIREANSSGDITLYALAQCIPDMSSSSCLNCLRNVINVLHKCCDELRGARVQFPSCFMRHEVYPFYNQHNVPALSKHQGVLVEVVASLGFHFGSKLWFILHKL
ncbi:putative protein ASPARTIC PROTEASE IN GUARD CELL 2-like [Capsicum annuum]|nr:putative protein ASPARTIC PROTEASE IN GUARD CELL 2-like [Capsicum annuum]